MSVFRSVVLLLCLICLSSSVVFADEDFFIKDGDVVCFWGNSITDYSVYARTIENFVLAEHPDWNVEFVNLGWGGDHAKNVQRLRRDIQLCKPTKVTIMLGMNDGRYRPLNQEFLDLYIDSLSAEIDIFREHSNAEIMLISPTPYDLRARVDRAYGKVGEDWGNLSVLFYPQTLERFSYELGQLALRKGAKYVDLNSEFSFVLNELDVWDKNYRLTPEGVHPNVDGHLVMSLCILKGMQAFGQPLVSTIDVGSSEMVPGEGVSLENLNCTSMGLSFTMKSPRIPVPVHPATRPLIKKVMGWPDNYDTNILKINNLDSGWYMIEVDKNKVGVVSSADLIKGVNLNDFVNNPQVLQSNKLLNATEIRNQAFYQRWRSVLLKGVYRPTDYTPFHKDAPRAVIDSLISVEKSAYALQHELNKPLPHNFRVYNVEHAAMPVDPTPKANAFIDNLISLRFEVDSRTIPSFTPPLCIQGSIAFNPDYSWALQEEKSYYAEEPVPLYDDGTHGDKTAGDGIYSLTAYVRKNDLDMWFWLKDGVYLQNYWNDAYPAELLHNPYLEQISRVIGEDMGFWNEERKRLNQIPMDQDRVFVWDMKYFKKATKEGRLYKVE